MGKKYQKVAEGQYGVYREKKSKLTWSNIWACIQLGFVGFVILVVVVG